MNENNYKPHLIAWELTRKCLLNCKHCRAGAAVSNTDDELKTEEVFKVMDSIAESFSPIIILTGGEPMMRSDVYEIAKYGTYKGLRMTMAPCGMLINDKTVLQIKDSGIKRISLSLDGANAETHDDFRQGKGSFDKVIEAAKIVNVNDLEFQINTTVHEKNKNELPKILEIAEKLGAKSFHPFILVPAGRAKNLSVFEIKPDEYESILEWIAGLKNKTDLNVKPTCAPHYHRIIRQTKNFTPAENNGMNAMTKGCMGGQSFAFISNTGKVQICGFLNIEAGDIRKEGYSFTSIWNKSELFKEMRDIDNYHGKCGVCGFKKVCGGCRARAYAFYKDYLGEEPYCNYSPDNGVIS